MTSRTKNLNTLPGGKLNNFLNQNFDKFINFKSSKKFYIILLAVVLLLLIIYKKSWFIAATVDSSIITNFELLSKMNQQFRQQTLNQMINEKILLQEASKKGITIQNSELEGKIIELEQNVGGAGVLDNLLSQQGQTRSTLRDQVRVQLTISKLYDQEATVSAEEVAKFLEQNRASLQATDSAKQEEEAFNLLKQQKLSEIFNQKFQELRQKANIKIF